MVFHNPIAPRLETGPPPPANFSEIIWTNPDDVPMFTPLTPEQYAALPHPNYAPRLLITIWVLLGIAAVFLALRLYCKFSRHRGAWWDDWFLVGAFLCLLGECACLTRTSTYGYGRYWFDWDPNPENGKTMFLLINSAGSMTLTAATWSKTSFALTLLRLTEGKMKWLLWFIIVTMNIFMGLSALFNWIQCTPISATWDATVSGKCWDPAIVPRYNIFSSSYSSAMDFTLALLPWTVIWNLQMKLKEKIGVAIAMSCGVFAGVTAVVKTTKIPAMASPNPGPSVDLYIWGNAESCVTIVAACIPILRVLIREVKTSAQRYYLSNPNRSGVHTSHNTPHASKARDNVNTITITGGKRRGVDSSSGESRDEDERGLTRESGKILQTREVAVEYQDNRDWDEHEMDEMQRSHKSL